MRVAIALATLALAATLTACGTDEPDRELPGQEFESAVPDGFFGINGQGLRPLAENGQIDLLDQQLATVSAGGVDFVRANTDWPRTEPAPPVGEEHAYELAGLDAFVGALAQHGLEWQPAVMGVPTPQWAVDTTAAKVCGLRAPPARPEDLAALATALAERYGRNGTYWQENADVEPIPVTHYEIWNEPNLGSFWCPIPDPEAFAELADVTADAILAVDPEAELILGGLSGFADTAIEAPGRAHYSVREFLERMLDARPELARKLDVIGVHAYGATPDPALDQVAYERGALDAVGLEHTPMSVNETGWYTAGVGATPPVPEETRAGYMGEVSETITRSSPDCDISSFAPHTWITPETNTGSVEDWYGIADPFEAVPYPTGQAYIDQVLRFEGRASEPPPALDERLCSSAAGG